jgi:hypothetical protein
MKRLIKRSLSLNTRAVDKQKLESELTLTNSSWAELKVLVDCSATDARPTYDKQP